MVQLCSILCNYVNRLLRLRRRECPDTISVASTAAGVYGGTVQDEYTGSLIDTFLH